MTVLWPKAIEASSRETSRGRQQLLHKKLIHFGEKKSFLKFDLSSEN